MGEGQEWRQGPKRGLQKSRREMVRACAQIEAKDTGSKNTVTIEREQKLVINKGKVISDDLQISGLEELGRRWYHSSRECLQKEESL